MPLVRSLLSLKVPRGCTHSVDVWARASTLLQDRPFSVRARDGTRRGAASAWDPAHPMPPCPTTDSKGFKNQPFKLDLEIMREIKLPS